MKKTVLSLILILVTVNICYSYSLNGFTTKFAKKFKNCDVFIEQSDFNANGKLFHDTKQITGWSGGNCGYRQTTKVGGMTLYAECSFTPAQVTELHNALQIQPKVFGVDNKTQEIWDKYVLDHNNCKLWGDDIFGQGIQVEKQYVPDLN